jgi:hypothetical protein
MEFVFYVCSQSLMRVGMMTVVIMKIVITFDVNSLFVYLLS